MAEETKEETKETPEAVEEKSAPSGKFADLIKQIEELSVMELADLVKELEERFGVSAAAPVAVAAAGVAGGEAGGEAEEKSSYDLHLADAGAKRLPSLKPFAKSAMTLALKKPKN